MSIIKQDYGSLGNDVQTQMLIAPVLAEMVATQPFAIGDQFIVDNILYKATKAIAIGDAISVGTDTTDNCVLSDSITQQIKNKGTWQTITSNDAPTGTTVKCKKDNSTIALHIDGRNMTSNQWVHLGTLPADMLPESNLYTAGTSSGTSGISVGYVHVDPSTGNINGWATQVQCHCDFAFMIKD